MSQSALVVCTDARRLSVYKRALGRIADVVYGATTFVQAKVLLLEKRPDVLVTEIRLREYNGMQLVLWGHDQLPELRTLILDETDWASHKDAIIEAVHDALAERNRPRRWPRNRVAHDVRARIGDQPARLVNVSYGGFCLETAAVMTEDPETGFTLDIPDFGVQTRARCVWAKAGTSGRYWCGAALAEEESRISGWRDLVDALRARPHPP